MMRWILRSIQAAALTAALTGCDRQVSISEPIEGVLAADPAPTTGPVDEGSITPITTVTNPGASPDADSATSEAAVRLTPPAQLAGVPGIGVLSPVLIGPDGNAIELSCCDAAGAYSAVVPLDNEGLWAGTIQWQAPFDVEPVTVLQADVFVDISAQVDSTAAVDITPDSYSLTLDSDGDGIENLTELVMGTSPFNVSDASEDFLSATVRIPRVTANQVPLIDGDVGEYVPGTTVLSGEWEQAVQVDVQGNRLSIGNLMFSVAGSRDAENHHWMALHDGTWLYLLAIIDDSGLHQFDSQEILKPWRDDSLELFVDGDNSMQSTYDSVDDFSMHVVLLDTREGGVNSSTNADPKLYRSVNSVPLPASVVFSTGPLKGPRVPEGFASEGQLQDVYEMAIRITDLNIELGRTFGFEFQFSDDDDAGDRDAKWGWFHPAGTTSDNDFSWRDPRFIGRAVLLP